MAYPVLGVENERKEHPAIKEGYVSSRKSDGGKSAIGFAPVDGQRLYKNTGGQIATGTKPRTRASGTQGVNSTRPGGFAVRKRTRKHY